MPTIRVVDDNVIEFVDSNGDVAAREEYDEAASEVSFVDGDGNPMPVSLGDATADSVSTGDQSNVSQSNYETALRAIAGAENIAQTIQFTDNSAPNGDSGYAATLTFIGQQGNRVGHLSADNGNEMSFYTRNGALSDDSANLMKRMDIHAGSRETSVDFVSVSPLQVYAGNNAVFRLIPAESNNDVQIYFADETEADRWAIFMDRSRSDSWNLFDIDGGNPVIRAELQGQVSLQPDGDISLNPQSGNVQLNGSPLSGVRPISNPTSTDLNNREIAIDTTNDRILFHDGDGNVHYINSDGTL